MKFQSLMAVLLLLLLLPPQAQAALTEEAADAWVYRNGDLVLDIRDTAGAEVLRASLAYFCEDEHIATANEAPAAGLAADARPPEPLSLGLLGAGLVMLGWTRRQGGQAASTRSWKQRLVHAIWPWPSLSWLDS